jgi:5-methylcytosine-specific restriction endonuclease McrA
MTPEEKRAFLEQKHQHYLSKRQVYIEAARVYRAAHPVTDLQKQHRSESHKKRTASMTPEEKDRKREKQKAYDKDRRKGLVLTAEEKNKRNEYMRLRRLTKKEVVAAETAETNHRRRARKLGNQIDPSGIAKWMREIRKLPFVRCHWCGTKVHGRQVHFDHVIAVSRGGSHSIGNLCSSCAPCNRLKAARSIADWIVGGQTFLPI